MTARPYSPSWIDRLIDWIDRLPGPAPVFYAAMYPVAVVAMHGALWLDEVVPVGELNLEWMLNGVWSLAALMWIHYLQSVARRALDGFAPLLRDKPSELEALRYRMLEMPARPVMWISLVAATLLAIGVATDPVFVYDGLEHPLAYLLVAPVMIFAYTASVVVMYFTVRLLRSVTQAYSLLDEVNVTHQRPLFALSGLTMRSGILSLLLTNLTILSIVFVEGDAGGTRGLDFAFVGIGAVVAMASFLLPLLGIHRRLVDAKNDLIEENASAVESTRLKLYRALDREEHSEVESFDRGLTSLFGLNDELQKIPTWPWRPGTLRTFTSAIVLPLLIWTAQRILTRYF